MSRLTELLTARLKATHQKEVARETLGKAEEALRTCYAAESEAEGDLREYLAEEANRLKTELFTA